MSVRVDLPHLRQSRQPDNDGLFFVTRHFDPVSGGSSIEFSGLSPHQRAAEARKPPQPWTGVSTFKNIHHAMLRLPALTPRERRDLIEAVPVELRNEPLRNGKSNLANDYYHILLLCARPAVSLTELGVRRVMELRKKQGKSPIRKHDDTDPVWRYYAGEMAKPPVRLSACPCRRPFPNK
jgi:hypothetical protein